MSVHSWFFAELRLGSFLQSSKPTDGLGEARQSGIRLSPANAPFLSKWLIGSINHVSTEVEKYPGSTRTPENALIASGNQEEHELTAVLYEICHLGEQ